MPDEGFPKGAPAPDWGVELHPSMAQEAGRPGRAARSPARSIVDAVNAPAAGHMRIPAAAVDRVTELLRAGQALAALEEVSGWREVYGSEDQG